MPIDPNYPSAALIALTEWSAADRLKLIELFSERQISAPGYDSGFNMQKSTDLMNAIYSLAAMDADYLYSERAEIRLLAIECDQFMEQFKDEDAE